MRPHWPTPPSTAPRPQVAHRARRQCGQGSTQDQAGRGAGPTGPSPGLLCGLVSCCRASGGRGRGPGGQEGWGAATLTQGGVGSLVGWHLLLMPSNSGHMLRQAGPGGGQKSFAARGPCLGSRFKAKLHVRQVPAPSTTSMASVSAKMETVAQNL